MLEEPQKKSIAEVLGYGDGAPQTPSMKAFAYQAPAGGAANRRLSPLARTDVLLAMVQTFVRGGEQQLHSHSAMDGFWFVLSGRARFYGAENLLVAELGRFEGVLVPRGTPYWFEQCGDEPLEILQVEAIDQRIPNVMTRFDKTVEPGEVDVFAADGKLIAEGIQLSGGKSSEAGRSES